MSRFPYSIRRIDLVKQLVSSAALDAVMGFLLTIEARHAVAVDGQQQQISEILNLVRSQGQQIRELQDTAQIASPAKAWTVAPVNSQ